MTYDADAVARYFDAFGIKEYERHDASPEQRIKHELHLGCLREHVRSGSTVLEIGAGPGRFTEVLAEMGCRTTVIDLSPEQLRLNRERAEERGYASSIDAWLEADIVDLAALGDRQYAAIVAFGGPFSYVLEKRDRAMQECLQRLEPDGRLLLSVMSLWGTTHAFLGGISDLPPEEIEAVNRTGDLTPATSPIGSADGHFLHMFTADELRAFLERHGLSVELLAASNALCTRWSDLLAEEKHFRAVLDLERRATRASGALDMGTHIIAVAHNEGPARA